MIANILKRLGFLPCADCGTWHRKTSMYIFWGDLDHRYCKRCMQSYGLCQEEDQ